MKRRLNLFLTFSITVMACNLLSSVSNPLGTATPTSPVSTPMTTISISATMKLPTSTPTSLPATPTPTALPTPKPLDLAHHPLYWFAPLPPQRGGPYDGSDDFITLFTPEADWEQTAGYLQVFKLYGGWTAHEGTDAQLQQVIEAIRQRGLGLAVELGPLNPIDECGHYIEGFAGEEGVQTVKRIKAAGGDLNLIAFDEPYYYGHFYDGEYACKWSAEKIAQEIDSFIRQVRFVFPDVIIGDIEPLTGPADETAYNAWLDTFREVNGYDLAFLHLDIDWADTRWPQKVQAIVDYGQQIGVPIGIIYNGNSQDQTDEAWVSIAGERIKRYEIENNGNPDHVIFQSWHDKPDHALPESDPYTYTGFIKTYFEDKSALGFQLENSANVALKKLVRVSRHIDGFGGESAVDGDPGTSWNSGDDAPQWIEIDLGEGFDVREIRLLPSQYPAGLTYHRVRGKGPGTGGEFVELYNFEGETEDSKWLVYTPPKPWVGIQIVRIETVASPSWVAWREIEILR